ncbi:MAG: AraC family transcriptional regulator [Clostridiales bacterium]|nr:AraC family transcriptional regulator [Clostridiales bacterium]
MSKQLSKDFSELLEDEYFVNSQHKLGDYATDTIIDFDPKILYIAMYYAEDRDVFLKTPHKHDFAEIAYVAKGECEIMLDDETFPLHENEAVLYSPGVNHVELPADNNNIELYFMAFSNINLNTFLGEGDRGNPPIVNFRKQAQKLTDMFREMTMELKNKQPFHQLYLSNLGNLIILQTLRLLAPEHTKFISKDCKEIVNYLDSHFCEDINLDELASRIFFSKHYLSHMFKEEMGVSPIKYMIDKRIEESKRLLAETDFSITKIASAVGYPDTLYFSQFFKKKVGLSPNEYRNSVIENGD